MWGGGRHLQFLNLYEVLRVTQTCVIQFLNPYGVRPGWLPVVQFLNPPTAFGYRGRLYRVLRWVQTCLIQFLNPPTAFGYRGMVYEVLRGAQTCVIQFLNPYRVLPG